MARYSHSPAAAPRRPGRRRCGRFPRPGRWRRARLHRRRHPARRRGWREWRRRAYRHRRQREIQCAVFEHVTMRSHQPRAVFTYWRIGRASKNSLATSNSGRSARLSSKCVLPADVARRNVRAVFRLHLAAGSGWLRPAPPPARAQKFRRHASAARRASAIKVPRPGPSSTSRVFLRTALVGPGLHQPQAEHLAEHLADLRRGDEIARPRRTDRGWRNSRLRDRAAPGS